jgi:outer membrane lipoprotein-sorting protein
MKRTILLCLFFFILVIYISGAEPDFQKILYEIDNLGNFDGSDFSCVYTIVSEKPGEEKSVTQARLFRRDANDQFVLLILQPQIQKGQGYLMVDENVWFYDPESRKFEKSTLRENVQDSDAQNSDFNRNSLQEDYIVEDWTEGLLGKFPVYILDLKAKRTDVPYDKIKLWVRQDINIVLKEEDYSVSNRLMRTTLYPKYQIVDDKYLPLSALIIDELNKGERTQYTIKDPTTSAIPDYVFTKTYLERVNN